MGSEEEIVDLYNLEVMIIDATDEKYEEVEKIIFSSKYVENKKGLRQLLLFLNSLVTINRFPLNLLFRLLLSFKEKIPFFSRFEQNELCFFFEQKQILLFLIESGIIDFHTISEELGFSESQFFFFYPEFKKDPFSFYSFVKENQDIWDKIKSTNIESHLKRRKEGKNEQILADSIQKNDFDQFLEIWTKNNEEGIVNRIRFSDYERFSFVNNLEAMPTLIEYAAFFGAISIFKFLWITNATVDDDLPQFAIAGGNSEIIYMCEEKELEFDGACIKVAIQFHRNDIAEYLHEKYGIKYTEEHLLQCIYSQNYKMFLIFMSPSLTADSLRRNRNIFGDIIISEKRLYDPILLNKKKTIDLFKMYEKEDEESDSEYAQYEREEEEEDIEQTVEEKESSNEYDYGNGDNENDDNGDNENEEEEGNQEEEIKKRKKNKLITKFSRLNGIQIEMKKEKLFYSMKPNVEFHISRSISEIIEGTTLFISAINQGYIEIAEFLMAHFHNFLNVDSLDKEENSALRYAILNNRLDIVKLIFLFYESPFYHSKILYKSKEIVNCYNLAARQSRPKIVRFFLNQENFDPNKSLKNGFTGLHFAAFNGNIDVIRVFKEKDKENEIKKKGIKRPKINFNTKESKLMYTPLHIAVEKQDIQSIKELISIDKVDVNAQAKNGLTPIQLAIKIGNIEIVKILVDDEKVDINIQTTPKKYTPLHFAVKKRNVEIIKYLLGSPRIDINLKNKGFLIVEKNKNILSTYMMSFHEFFYLNPLYYAVAKENKEIVVLFDSLIEK